MSKRLKRLTTVLLAAWLPLAGADAHAGPCPPVIVGVSDLGYSSYLDGAVIRGINIDMFEQMEKRSGCKLTPRWYPRTRMYAQFLSGELEMTGGALRTPERDLQGTWLPYTYTQFELLLVNQEAGKFRSLAEFVDHSKARLNINRGMFYAPDTQAQLDRLQKLGRLEYVNDFDVVFRKIQAGRAEGTLAPASIHLLNQRRFGLLGKMTGVTVTDMPRAMVGLYVSKKVPPEVQQRYADALRSIIADGSLLRLYEKYLGAVSANRLYHDGTRAILDALPQQQSER
ncbi:substrate-binding periplasmic protein [Duganella sp. BuS-21]|uniref:substrate-binding periplasmic protein n=1 Tax=Duganella sp. BuS-21 TaxID=2943848 RepID=UPI0035A5944B